MLGIAQSSTDLRQQLLLPLVPWMFLCCASRGASQAPASSESGKQLL